MALKKRVMSATFVLGTGTFGSTGKNTATVSKLRMGARINRAGGPAMSTAMVEIYGLTLSFMNQLSTLGLVATTLRRNSITIMAGDSDSQTVVFQGTITNAYPDLDGAPNVPFRVEAHTGLIDSIAPADPVSYPKGTTAQDALASIAAKMGVPFENNGVSVALPPGSYYYGSLRNQALAIVEHAGISWNGMEDATLAIWNPGESRGGEAPLISKATGLVNYPSFNSNGISLRTIFNPAIGFGKKISVQTALNGVLSKAAGKGASDGAKSTWVTFDLNHELETLTPHGSWFSDLKARPLSLGPVVP